MPENEQQTIEEDGKWKSSFISLSVGKSKLIQTILSISLQGRKDLFFIKPTLVLGES
jgi:hypothetical protein